MTRSLTVPALVLLLLSLALPGHAQEAPPGAVPYDLQVVPPGGGSPRTVRAWEREGVISFSLNDLSLLLGGTKFWRAELGRMTLGVGDHEAAVTEGSEIAVIDGDQLLRMPGPAYMWKGEILVPLSLVFLESGEPRPWVEAPVRFFREERRLEAGKKRGGITSAELVREPAGWKLVLEADVPLRPDVLSTTRSSFVVRLPSVTYDPMLYPLPTQHAWFQGLRLRQIQDVLELSFTPGPRAVGYSFDRGNNRLEVFLGLDERDLREGRIRAFSQSPHQGESRLMTVALDPGHGGKDKGDRVEGEPESFLTWKLCELLERRLRNSLGVEVALTRGEKEGADPDARAAAANRARADLFLSVHVHSRPGGPAGFVADIRRSAAQPVPGLAALGFRPFGGGQVPYLATSRLVARFVLDAVGDALDAVSLGIHAEPIPELGAAAMPAMVLELGGDRRWTEEELDKVAGGVVEGLRLYRFSEGEGR